jgi:hypothetical protein
MVYSNSLWHKEFEIFIIGNAENHLIFSITHDTERRLGMLPALDDPRWNQLLIGTIKHEFRAVSAGLMVSRLKRRLADDGSADNRRKCLEEAYAFFRKYETILADDIAAVFH